MLSLQQSVEFNASDSNKDQENSEKSPDGPVQQYVNSNGGPYYPSDNTYSNNYPFPYYFQHPNSQQPNMPQPNMNQPIGQSNFNSNQQNMQQQNVPAFYFPMLAEYEGFLVPVQTIAPPSSNAQQQQHPQQQQQQQQQPQMKNNPPRLDHKVTPARNIFDLAVVLQSVLPPNVLQLIVTWGSFILNSISVMVFAGLITSAICSLTPICTISFGALPLSLQKQFTIGKMANANGTDVSTIQRVRRAAEMFTNALDKYEKLQKGVDTLKMSLKNRKHS